MYDVRVLAWPASVGHANDPIPGLPQRSKQNWNLLAQ